MGIKLTDDQQQAVDSNARARLVNAGAGTGKTTFVCSDITEKAKQRDDLSALLLTFTRKAKEDMEIRVNGMLGEAGLYNNVEPSTYHSFSLVIIKKFKDLHPKLKEITKPIKILTMKEKKKILKPLFVQNEIDSGNTEPKKVINKMFSKFWIGYEEYIKQLRRDPYNRDFDEIKKFKKDYSHFDFQPILEDLVEEGYITFNNIIDFAYDLSKSKLVQKWFQRNYTDVYLDEYQDTDHIQHGMIKNLINLDIQNITAVGDSDQIIYEWRNASPRMIGEVFQKDFNAEMFNLISNFRSVDQIVQAGNIISKYVIKNPIKESLVSFKGGEGSIVFNYQADENHIDKIKWIINWHKRSTFHNRTLGVLCRVNSQLDSISDQLTLKKINHIFDTTSFFDRIEIQTFCSLISLTREENIKTYTDLFQRSSGVGESKAIKIVSKIMMDFGDVSTFIHSENKLTWIQTNDLFKDPDDMSYFERLCNAIEETLVSIRNKEDLANFEKQKIFKHLCLLSNSSKWYSIDNKEETGRKSSQKQERLKLLIKNLISSEKENIIEILTDLRLENTIIEKEKVKTNQIFLSTVHKAKGLEYDDLLIIDSYDQSVRDVKERKISQGLKPEIVKAQLAEEKRIRYVALTRAKENITIINESKSLRETLSKRDVLWSLVERNLERIKSGKGI